MDAHTSRFWLNFDIGLSTSFENLYAWLDDNNAIECGDNTATFVTNKSFETVARELKNACRDGGGSRLYLIGKPPKAANGGPNLVGRFIVGRRKAPPWSGFGSVTSYDEKDEG
jgi:hypothetical protein